MTISNVQKARMALLGALMAIEPIEVLEDCRHAKEAIISLWMTLDKPLAIEVKPKRKRRKSWWKGEADGQSDKANRAASEGSADLGPDQSHR